MEPKIMEKTETIKKTEKTEKPNTIKRMIISGQLTQITVYISAAIPAAIFLILAMMAQLGTINPLRSGDVIVGTSVDFVIFAILTATGILGVYEFYRLRKIRKIDDRFPDFVRDMAESRRAGMTFTKAIMYSAKGNYGVLTPEIQKIARQISWGSSVDNALSAFAKRVNTKLIRRTVSLIIEASRSGGNVADVLDAASTDARELKLIDSERRASMLSYVAVIYVGMGVFLMILVILTKSLIPSMVGEGAVGLGEASSKIGSTGGGGITKQAITEVFYYGAMIQCMGMGLVTGVFEDGKIAAGIKHTFIMALICWIIFKLVVTGV